MITDLDVTKVEGVRKSKEQITNMKFNINFDDVSVVQDSVKVSYTFVASYEGGQQSNPENVGELKVSGTITSKEDKKAVEEIQKAWKEKKTLPLGFAENIINVLNFECGTRGTFVAHAVGLIAPVPLTRARLQESPKGSEAAA